MTIAGSGRLATMRSAWGAAIRSAYGGARLGSTLVAFRPGTEITRREVLHGRLWLDHPVTVVADDGDVLAVLLEPGSRFRFHEHPFGPHPWSAHDAWGETTVLQLHREGDAYGVWKFFEGGVFTRWYVNFEAPVVRHDGRIRHRRPRARPDRAPRRTSGVEGRRPPVRAGHVGADDRPTRWSECCTLRPRCPPG